MKYKVGDKVRIKSLDWYNRYTNGTEVDCGAYPFTSDMKEFCGQERIIANVCQECYFLLGIDDKFVFTDEMIEGLVEEECYYIQADNIPDALQVKVSSACSHNGFYGYSDSEGNETSEWNLPEGYQFVDENGNVINATKIVLEKKKKEYPKTYEECAKIMNCPIDGPSGWLFNFDANIKDPYYRKIDILMGKFARLFICRDAYWKLYGEEIGLGKPWKPDYDSGVNKFGIICLDGVVQESNPTTNWERHLNKILDFPTREMRDAFYENFKELIEQCKELL